MEDSYDMFSDANDSAHDDSNKKRRTTGSSSSSTPLNYDSFITGSQNLSSYHHANQIGASNSRAKPRGDSNIGQFEKHTKGIGMKLLVKMGYRGGGLGKNEQGVVAPIEASLQQKKKGIGFDNGKQKQIHISQDHAVVKQRQKQRQSLLEERSRTNENYVAREKLLAISRERECKNVVQEVIDMRGPQEKYVKPMPEIHYNLDLIVDSGEFDRRKWQRELMSERENVVRLQKEKENLRAIAGWQKQQLDVLLEIMGVVEQIQQENALGALTIGLLFDAFHDLKSRYPEEYRLCKLSCIACSLALPLLKEVFLGWEPLQDSSHGIQEISFLQCLLQEDYSDACSIYSQSLMEVVFPPVRMSVTNSWNPRDPEPLITFFELWEEILSPSIRLTILESLVMPKLSQAVESWDPKRESALIHTWVHPWLPYLDKKLESLYQPVASKLGNALRPWHPSDGSAYVVLSPWKSVFDQARWKGLLARYIVPKLEKVLQEIQIDPITQNLDQFSWVMAWASDISTRQLVRMLDQNFFPKWQQALYHWLCSGPYFEDVRQWFLRWTGLLPQKLLDNKNIESQLEKGLEMMNQAVDGIDVVPPETLENDDTAEMRQFEAQWKEAACLQQKTSERLHDGVDVDIMNSDAVMSLKEAIEVYAQQNDLLFKPKPGRTFDGLQVYAFGKISICFLNDKLYALRQVGWSLVTLEMLKEMQNNFCSNEQYCY